MPVVSLQPVGQHSDQGRLPHPVVTDQKDWPGRFTAHQKPDSLCFLHHVAMRENLRSVATRTPRAPHRVEKSRIECKMPPSLQFIDQRLDEIRTEILQEGEQEG